METYDDPNKNIILLRILHTVIFASPMLHLFAFKIMEIILDTYILEPILSRGKFGFIMNIISKSLRFRIVLVFCGFSILLGTAMFAGILISTKYTEQYALKKRLQLETERYIESISRSPISPVAFSSEIPVPDSPYMTSYLGEDLMPEWAVKELSHLKEGNYEKQNDKQNYYINIRDLQDGQRFYLLFNVTTLLNDHSMMNIIREYLMITLLPTFILGLMLGVITAYKAVSPVVRLTKIVKSKDETGYLPKDMAQKFESDEVGFLATTLEHAIREMQSAIDREKAFARDASHELRTPLTVMQGAIKILSDDVRDDDFKKQNVLSRLKRAAMNMEHLINSFLWLSRQERRDTNGTSRVAEVARECIDNNLYLMRNKQIKITLNEYEQAVLPVAPEILTIILGNLIRNAMTYTQQGEIIISIYGPCISVQDSGPGIPKHVLDNINVVGGVSKADGFGFGLSIVHRMCSQLDWRLNIQSEEGKGSKIILCCSSKGRPEQNCPGVCKPAALSNGVIA